MQKLEIYKIKNNRITIMLNKKHFFNFNFTVDALELDIDFKLPKSIQHLKVIIYDLLLDNIIKLQINQ